MTLGTSLTPVLAFAFSYLGCLLGLVATARARRASQRERARWLVLGSWAIGGTGIWVMHFVAMIGVAVNGTDVNYDVPITIASWLIAVLVVGAGLFIVGYSRPSAPRIIAAGVFTGVGVAGMHYTGVGAMRMNAHVSYDHVLVGLSIAIAVVAATAALWFTVTVRRARWITIAAGIMAVAVTGMHYTGISAMNVHATTTTRAPSGVKALDFVPAILIFVLLVSIVLAYALLIEPAATGRPPLVGGTEAPRPGPAGIDPRHRAGFSPRHPAAHQPAAQQPPAQQPPARWAGLGGRARAGVETPPPAHRPR